RARDGDAALVDEMTEAVGRVLGRAVRQAVLAVQHELHRSVEQSRGFRLFEREAVDLVVAAPRSVERRTEPADLDRVHERTVKRARPTPVARRGRLSAPGRRTAVR